MYMRPAKTDQTARMRSLIRVLAVRTNLIVGFVVRWLIYLIPQEIQPSLHSSHLGESIDRCNTYLFIETSHVVQHSSIDSAIL